MNGGRKEKLSRQRLEVWLSDGEQQVFGERASTENISHGGMRVQTARPWKAQSRLRVKAMIGDLRATARVVSCQFLRRTPSRWDWSLLVPGTHNDSGLGHRSNGQQGKPAARAQRNRADSELR